MDATAYLPETMQGEQVSKRDWELIIKFTIFACKSIPFCL